MTDSVYIYIYIHILYIYIYIVLGVYKPTYNWGASHCFIEHCHTEWPAILNPFCHPHSGVLILLASAIIGDIEPLSSSNLSTSTSTFMFHCVSVLLAWIGRLGAEKSPMNVSILLITQVVAFTLGFVVIWRIAFGTKPRLCFRSKSLSWWKYLPEIYNSS